MRKKTKTGNEKVRIIPLGGLEQIGMNITAFETENSIIVVDCGLAFPEDDMLGVDLVIPDVTYLKDHREKVKGFVITHDARLGQRRAGKKSLWSGRNSTTGVNKTGRRWIKKSWRVYRRA